MNIISKHSKFHLSSSSSLKNTSIDIFNEILKELEIIECTEIETRVISYGVIFTGLYRNVGFEFNVYINAQGHLNRKTRQNPVWHKPVTLPDIERRD